jgi:anaerobic selenocysteine-containing dehydrogenase
MAVEFDRILKSTVWSPGPGCHGGCGCDIYVKDGKVVKIEGDENHPWNQGRGCSRLLAMTLLSIIEAAIIILKARRPQRNAALQRISWDELYDIIVRSSIR